MPTTPKPTKYKDMPSSTSFSRLIEDFVATIPDTNDRVDINNVIV